uniref:C-type lectin domain-containing protein n=1 Tax=Cyprinodon variegatus TaxID=28743 RepID=A0A3Q2CWW0_CYPVA
KQNVKDSFWKYLNITCVYGILKAIFPPILGQYLQKGWLYFHDRLYYISSTEKTWHESKEYCRQQGAELVIINNKEEQDFTRQFNRLTWIGLHDPAMTREWTWVNGDPLITRFYLFIPNGYENNTESCVEIRDFNWNDEPCGNQKFWICEKDGVF